MASPPDPPIPWDTTTASPPDPPIPWDYTELALEYIQGATELTPEGALVVEGDPYFLVAGRRADCQGSAWTIHVCPAAQLGGSIALPMIPADLTFMQGATFSSPNKWTKNGTTMDAMMKSTAAGSIMHGLG